MSSIRHRRNGPTGLDVVGAEQVRARIRQAAAAPDVLEPRHDFVAELHRRLSAELDGDPGRHPTQQPTALPAMRRRRLLQAAAAGAGALALGAAADRAVEQARGSGRDGAGLVPQAGEWTPSRRPLTSRRGRRCHSRRCRRRGRRRWTVDGGLWSVQPQDCLLRLDAGRRRWDCRCHATSFSLVGKVLHHSLPEAPAPLPQLEVRQRGNQVEVLLPRH